MLGDLDAGLNVQRKVGGDLKGEGALSHQYAAQLLKVYELKA